MKRIRIYKDGRIEYMKDDFDLAKELKIKRRKEIRLSWIIPKNILKRIFWIILRKIFDFLGFEKGINWLRSWKTDWILILGKEKYYFKNRSDAVKMERSFFEKGGMK